MGVGLALSAGSGCEIEEEVEGFDLEHERAKPILCAGDQCVDGVRDAIVVFTLGGAELPVNHLQPGDRLHLSGYETVCWDDACADPGVFVRTSSSDKLIAASFDSNVAKYQSARIAPFSIDIRPLNDGLCAPYYTDEECEFVSRATFDVISSDDAHPGYARLVERTSGWAPGGYRVSAGKLWLASGGDCEGYSVGTFTIMRDACDADSECPPADVADSCEQPHGPWDRVRAYFPQWQGYEVYGRYEAHCEVMGGSYGSGQVTVNLDCAFITLPKIGDEM